MGNYTTNLGLYNTDMTTDGNDTFDFQRDLNDNNDKIDSAIGKLSTLTTTDKSSLVNAIIEIVSNCGALSNLTTSAKTSLVVAINELVTNSGSLSNLTTSAKTNLVSAINELVTSLGGKASKSLNDLNATGQAIIDKKVEVEALLAQNGYAKFSWKVNNTISKIIIQWGQSTAKGWRTVSFPTSYNLSNPCIATTINDSSQTFYNIGVLSVTQSQFQIKISISNQDKSVYWLSMGY